MKVLRVAQVYSTFSEDAINSLTTRLLCLPSKQSPSGGVAILSRTSNRLGGLGPILSGCLEGDWLLL